jgi:antitoxin HigA-1
MIFNPAHPGEVLRDYLGGISIAEAATRLGVTRAHLSRILNGHAGVSAAMSLKLSAALNTSPEFWLKMQMQYDLWQAQRAKQPKIRPFPRLPKAKELAPA